MSNKENQQAKEPLIDIQGMFKNLIKYWWLFLASAVICAGMAWLYLRVKLPEYQVYGTFMISSDDNSPTGASGASSMLKSFTSLGMGGSKVDNEVVVMNSVELKTEMINNLKLNRKYIGKTGFLQKVEYYNNSPVEIDAPNAVFDTLSVSLSFKIKIDKQGKAKIKVQKGMFNTLKEVENVTLPINLNTGYGIYYIHPTKYYKPGQELNLRASVIGNILEATDLDERLAISIVSRKADAIKLNIKETNVQRGKDVINMVMQLYNKRSKEQKNLKALETSKFIDERLALIYKELTGSESDIEAFKKANNIVDVQEQAKSVVGKQLYAEQASITLSTRYRIVEMIRDFVKDPKNKGAYIPFGADSTTAAAPVAAYNRLITTRFQLLASAKDNNEAVRNLDKQIEMMRGNVLKGVENSLRALQVHINQANALNQKSLGTMSQFPTQERIGRELLRNQAIQNELYIFLLQKREENQLVLASTTSKGQVVDHGWADPEPTAPKLSVVLLVTIFMMLLLPAIILYIKKLFTTKFYNQEELEDLVRVPVIGHIHHNRHKTQLVVRAGRTTPIVELFRYVRNNIQFMLHSDNAKVVLVTSTVSGEGKSFISANVASSFALLGKRVALVGLDIRSPKLHEVLSVNALPGITSYLSDPQVKLHDIAQKAEDTENLDVYVGGAVPPNPSELLLTERTKQLFEELRTQYDLVIIDSAPIGLVSDTFSLARYADATVFVTRAGYTKRAQLTILNKAVADNRLTNVGAIVNDTKPTAENTYGYGYSNDQ